ncbi:hypothetical protein JAAARDRAFT_85225, partial [Jaapia argillacea MUCL 33604]
IAKGVEHIHLSGIVHGDLTPNNVLVDNGMPKLCDFGRSRDVTMAGFTASIVAGTIRYMAPELVPPEDDNNMPRVTMESDIYAFSMVTLEV